MVCRWAGERATRERNTPVHLGIGSCEGDDTKEDGTEESEDEIHIEKAQGSSQRRFYDRTLPSSATHRGGECTAQADVGHGIMKGTIGPTRENPRVRPGPTGKPRYLLTSREVCIMMKPIIAITIDSDAEIQQNEPNIQERCLFFRWRNHRESNFIRSM